MLRYVCKNISLPCHMQIRVYRKLAVFRLLVLACFVRSWFGSAPGWGVKVNSQFLGPFASRDQVKLAYLRTYLSTYSPSTVSTLGRCKYVCMYLGHLYM